jgi:O-antigen/teichoic acid export membrane protein
MSIVARAGWPSAGQRVSQLRDRLAARGPALVFVVSVGAANVASLLGNALAFRWVDPASMGVWHTLLLVNSYLIVVRLGLISGMGRELPFAMGSGDIDRARRIAATAAAYNNACSVLAALTFGVLSVVFWGSGRDWQLALPAMAVISATNLYLSYLTATFRSDADFARLARVYWVQAITALFMPVAVYSFGFTGLCAHAALQALLVCGCAHAWRPFRVAPRFDPVLAGQLIATGMPLFIGGYLQTVAMGFDRVILLQRGTVETVGYYAPAIAVIHAMAIVPGALSTYVYPRMSYALGQGRKAGALGTMAFRALATSLLSGLPIAVLGWIAAPYVVTHFFPRYQPSIPAVQWSLLSGLLWSVSPAVQALGSLKAWRRLSLYIAVLLSARWFFPWFLSQGSDPLGGVARGNVWAAAVVAVAALLLVRHATQETAAEAAA